MAQTLDGMRLKDVRVFGREVPTAFAEACISASISLSASQVTQLSMTFADTADAALYRSGVLATDTNIEYGGWRLIVDDVGFGPGSIGPVINITCPSRYVAAFKRERGAFVWGTWIVSDWVRAVAEQHGMKCVVQPDLGVQNIVREGPTPEQPDAMPQNTWDVITNLARTVGVWMYEVRDTLYFGKPTWLAANVARTIPLYWNSWSDYSEVMAGMPSFTESGAGEAQQLQIGLVSPDADEVVPGDVVVMTANGKMSGKWIVESVAFPMTTAGPVQISCKRINNPSPQAAPSAAPTVLGVGAVNWASGNFTGGSFITDMSFPEYYKPGTAYNFLMGLFGQKVEAASGGGSSTGNPVTAGKASVDGFVAKYNGVALDWDGVYGAQCVDLTAYYFWEVCGAAPASGNGKDIYYNQNAGVTKVPAGNPARPGDVACWGAALGGGYGHVAVVLQDMGGTLATLSQNPGPCHYQNITKVGLIGYLRPTRAL